MANTALNRTGQLLLTNKSGGAVAQGDVVIIDTANAAAFTTTTTSAYVAGTIGVVLEPNGIANNAAGMIALQGYVPVVNLSGTGSIGDLIKTHTVAKQGVRNAAPIVSGNFGQALGTSATPVALLWGTVSPGTATGNVATDAIWDAKGDLAIGTGANTAAVLTAGANGLVPVYASGETTGVKPAYPQPQIITVSATASDAHTANNTWQDINSMSVSITPPFASAKLVCWFTCNIALVSANFAQFAFRFDLDGTAQSLVFAQGNSANPVSSPFYTGHIHAVFEGVSAAAHTIKAQWHDNGSSQDGTITGRQLTVMSCQ